MVVAPCSIRSMGEIASGVTSSSSTLFLKSAADCLMLRETRRHIKSMQMVTKMGAIVAPPVPAFYAHCIEEMIDQTNGRVLDLFDALRLRTSSGK